VDEVRIVEQTDAYIVMLKPAGMHTAPLRPGERGTLLSRVLELFPEVAEVPGMKKIEPGLLHRLDRETSGLVIVARTASAFRHFTREADRGRFLKHYTAVCVAADGSAVPDWPFSGALRTGPAGSIAGTMEGSPVPDPENGFGVSADTLRPTAAAGVNAFPSRILSGFRPYGPGRVRVAPVPPERLGAADRLYRTEILSVEPLPDFLPLFLVRVRLERGFRHQVRCHLAAAGFPIAGDPLYLEPGLAARFSRLHLYADALEFVPPGGGPVHRVSVQTEPVFP
jgi:23S rRNA pseudouridine1911/1915/1917 synthase